MGAGAKAFFARCGSRVVVAGQFRGLTAVCLPVDRAQPNFTCPVVEIPKKGNVKSISKTVYTKGLKVFRFCHNTMLTADIQDGL